MEHSHLSGTFAAMSTWSVEDFLNKKFKEYHHPRFIQNDPIAIPHRFTKKQDIEIAGFLTATIAWGQRTTIIKNALRLMEYMQNSPHDFICQHSERDLKPLQHFVHRTFNANDLYYFIESLRNIYTLYDSMEDAFVGNQRHIKMEKMLIQFHQVFFSLEHFPRTRKHVSTPARNSACKRLNMFLRWMVRSSEGGVDFGIWKRIQPADLIIPFDIHVSRVACRLGLLQDTRATWKQAFQLTEILKQWDASDPVKYDFALFGLGIEERFR